MKGRFRKQGPGPAQTSEDRSRKGWSRNPGLLALTRSFWAGAGPLPAAHGTGAQGLPFRPDPSTVPPSRLSPSGQSGVGLRTTPTRFLSPEQDPQGPSASVSLHHLHPRMAHARWSEGLWMPVRGCPAVPTLTASRSQPSLPCAAMEAEPACFSYLT